MTEQIAHIWQAAGVLFGILLGVFGSWAWRKVWRPLLEKGLQDLKEELERKEQIVARYRKEVQDYQKRYLAMIRRFGQERDGGEKETQEGQEEEGGHGQGQG